ncbi:MAG: NRDE family protein [Planctomycetota bacterium]
MSPQSQSTQGTTAALIEDNLVILGQACDLVARVDNARYAQPHPDLGLSSIGSHLRHILDFYSLFLGAMQRFDGGEAVPVLDYDRRERRPAIETDAEQGALALRDIRAALEQRLGGPWPAALRVQTDSLGCKHAPQSDSSVERELQAMLSHGAPLRIDQNRRRPRGHRPRTRIRRGPFDPALLGAGRHVCTLSWIRTSEGLEVFFNRDEKHSRGPELPPEIDREGPLAYIAPTDGEAGGTWFAVNEAGVVLALLNGYQESAGPPPETPMSRGHLVRELARQMQSARFELTPVDLEPYQPLRLIALDTRGQSGLYWDGREIRPEAQPEPPIISSGFDPEGVTDYRKELWRSFCEGRPITDPMQALEYHRFAPAAGMRLAPACTARTPPRAACAAPRWTTPRCGCSTHPDRPCALPRRPARPAAREEAP